MSDPCLKKRIKVATLEEKISDLKADIKGATGSVLHALAGQLTLALNQLRKAQNELKACEATLPPKPGGGTPGKPRKPGDPDKCAKPRKRVADLEDDIANLKDQIQDATGIVLHGLAGKLLLALHELVKAQQLLKDCEQKTPPTDLAFRWEQATRFGIQIDEAANAWHAGHVNDVIEFDDKHGIILATESGGAWVIDADSNALPLSDTWDNPDVKCLALGPDGPRHVFAGCTLAYSIDRTSSSPVIMESNAAALAPLLDWHPVGNALPITAGRVTRMVVIRNLRRIVVSCAQVLPDDTGGIFWATIPTTRFAPGDPPRPPYVWRQAKVVGMPGAQGFWDLAVASMRNNPSRNNLEDRQTITVVAGGFRGGGLLVGRWDSSDELVFTRSVVKFDNGVDATGLLFDSCSTASVSSCEIRPTVVYAACSWPDGRLNSLLRSKDGGQTWTFCGSQKAGGTGVLDLIHPLAGDLGVAWTNVISAHPTNSGMVALGWEAGPFLTLDSGTTWRLIDGGPHLHSDLHALHFSSERPDSIGTLFVGSDGGVARIDLDDLLIKGGASFRSDYNRELPILQCYSTLIRQFYGTMDASRSVPGLIAAGLQDNGNVFCTLSPTVTPWQHADSGDGGWNAFLADGGYAHNIMGGSIQVSAESAGQIVTVTVPVTSPAPEDPTGIIGPVAEVVAQPRHRNAAGQLLVAVAAVKNVVYGLYGDSNAKPAYRWEVLGSIPADEYVAGLGSFLGDRVFAGTGNGKIYVIEVTSGKVVAQTVNLPRPTPATVMQGGSVLRIVGFSDTAMFALLIGATEAPNATGGVVVVPFVASLVPTYLLRLDGNTWNVTAGAGLPNEYTYGLVAVVAPQTRIPRGLLVSTDNEVYLSRDDGQNWQPAAPGLPRRPHAGDLRFVLDRKGGANIYLGTFGRSVWNLKLR